VRQSNLHLIYPARIVNRSYVEELYEHRYQREFANIVGLAWRLIRSERGGLVVVGYYALMQLASLAHRSGCIRLADWLRRFIPIDRVEQGCSSLLRASFGVVMTEAGGCAVDIDKERDYDVSRLHYADWHKAQLERAEKLYGPLRLGSGAAEPPVDS